MNAISITHTLLPKKAGVNGWDFTWEVKGNESRIS